MMLIKSIGKETELNAEPILKKEFAEVEWISNKKPSSPYDFVCKDSGDIFYIDVKSCIGGMVYIGKNKFNKLKNKEFGNFYYLLYKIGEFHLLSFEDLLKDNRYRIIFKKNKYIYSNRKLVKVSKKTKDKLDKMKIDFEDTYNNVIERLLRNLKNEKINN